MKIENLKNREFQTLYSFVSNGNDEIAQELKEAVKQKNILGNRHIFDIIASRGIISYDDISLGLKKMLEDIEDLPCEVLFEKKSIDILVENGKYYIDNKEVHLAYMLSYQDIVSLNKPIVIVPKDAFDLLVVKLGLSLNKGTSKQIEKNFTMTDIVKEAIMHNASDIHFKYDYNDQYNISFKIHGHLVRQKQFTMGKKISDDFFTKLRQKVALDTGSSFKSDEYNLPQGGILKYDELGVDLRIQFTPSGKLDKKNLLVCRILKKGNNTVGTIEDLYGYDEFYIDILRQATFYRRGLMLVVGITNSGKSTLTSHFINSIPDSRSIGSAQDPIEYPKNKWNITEHQTLETDKRDTSVGFLDYIKAWKRSDQDVNEIGEIRNDKDNNDLMDAVVEGVKSGNLIVSTAHIHSAFDVPKALMDVFGVERSVISDLLVLVTAQVLVEELCPYCKTEDTHQQNISVLEEWNNKGNIKFAWKKDLEDFLKSKPKTFLKSLQGCIHCNHTGIKGLTPIYEYYKPTVKMIGWLNQNLDTVTRFDIEKEFCGYDDANFAKNKLSIYIDKLKQGVVDTDIETIGKVLL